MDMLNIVWVEFCHLSSLWISFVSMGLHLCDVYKERPNLSARLHKERTILLILKIQPYELATSSSKDIFLSACLQ
jgi:hypothetical protein